MITELAPYAAAIVALIVALISMVTGRRRRKLDEVETLATLSANFREEIRKENTELKLEMRGIRRALLTLTNLLDVMMPSITGITDEQKVTLREASNAAKLASS